MSTFELTLTPEHEAFLAALRDLDGALDETLESVELMKARTGQILRNAEARWPSQPRSMSYPHDRSHVRRRLSNSVSSRQVGP